MGTSRMKAKIVRIRKEEDKPGVDIFRTTTFDHPIARSYASFIRGRVFDYDLPTY